MRIPKKPDAFLNDWLPMENASDHSAKDGAERGPSDQPSDQSLLRRFRSGDQNSATQLYLRYAPRLRALVRTRSYPELNRRFDADDIVQSVFRRFFQGVNRGKYEVPDGEELWKLFLVIALNKIRAEIKDQRKDQRPTATSADDHLQRYLQEPKQDETAMAFLELVVQEALNRLPAPHKQMVELRIDGFDVEEIADKSARSRRTVERVIRKFRDRLQLLLQEA